MAAKKRKSATRSTARKSMKRSAGARKKPGLRSSKASKSMSRTSMKKGSSDRSSSRMGPITNVDRAFTKGQLFTTLAGRTGIQRREIASLFEELKAIIQAHVKRQGPGQFTLPGLVKLTVTHKPATKARKGINPFTGEEMMFKAKPARNVVKARALKQLKEMAS